MIRHFNLAAQWIAPVVTIFVISCAKAPGDASRVQTISNSDEKAGTYKSPEELRAIVELALKKVTDPDARKNLAVRFVIARNYLTKQHNRMIDWLGKKDQPDELAQRHVAFDGGRLFPRNLKNADDPEVAVPFDLAESPIWNLVDYKIEYNKDRPCEPSSRGAHLAIAPLKDKPGVLCVSLQELAQHDETLRDAMAYLIHFAIELGGGSESEAHSWNSEFIEYYKRLIDDTWVQGAKTQDGWTKLEKSALALKTMISDRVGEWSGDDKALKALTDQIEKFHDLRTSFLPLCFDPLRFELGYKAVRPDLFDYYSNSALVLIDQSSYVFPDSKFYTSKAEALVKLSTTIELIKQVQQNFKAVATGETQPVCMSPAYGDAKSIFMSEKFRPGKRLALSIPGMSVDLFTPMVVHMSDNRIMMFPPAANCRGAR